MFKIKVEISDDAIKTVVDMHKVVTESDKAPSMRWIKAFFKLHAHQTYWSGEALDDGELYNVVADFCAEYKDDPAQRWTDGI